LAFLFSIHDGRAASGFARFAFFIVPPLQRRPPDLVAHSFLQENEDSFPDAIPVIAGSGQDHRRASEKATIRNKLVSCVWKNRH